MLPHALLWTAVDKWDAAMLAIHFFYLNACNTFFYLLISSDDGS